MRAQNEMREIIEMDGDSPPSRLSRLAAFTEDGGTMAAPLAEWVQHYAAQVREYYFENKVGVSRRRHCYAPTVHSRFHHKALHQKG